MKGVEKCVHIYYSGHIAFEFGELQHILYSGAAETVPKIPSCHYMLLM